MNRRARYAGTGIGWNCCCGTRGLGFAGWGADAWFFGALAILVMALGIGANVALVYRGPFRAAEAAAASRTRTAW